MSVALKNNIQEYDPRHRLTGAVVLILLTIILLPMLLERGQDEKVVETEAVVMEVTKDGNKVFVSRITSVAPETSSASSENIKSQKKKPAAENKKDESKEVSSALFKPMSHTAVSKSSGKNTTTAKKQPSKASSTKSSVKQTSASPSKSTAAKKPSAVVVSSGWVLQIGVFSQSANAKKKVSDLKKKGFNAKSGKVKTSKGMVTKVWIGPFNDRKSAEKMQDRLQHKTRQRGMVVKK